MIFAICHKAIKKVHSTIDFWVLLSNQNKRKQSLTKIKRVNLHIGSICAKGFKITKVAKVMILGITEYNWRKEAKIAFYRHVGCKNDDKG